MLRRVRAECHRIELAELDGAKAKAMRYAPYSALIASTQDGQWASPEITGYINLLLRQSGRLVAEVRRLRAENAELRKRAEWRETFKMKARDVQDEG